jgi:undecaprenyl-diphosphatase
MTILQALILGGIQGATEFLPISSSGHLVLVPWLLGWELEPEAAFIFDVLVQWGTLAAVLIYFRRDLGRLLRGAWRGICSLRPLQDHESRLFWLLLASSIPAAVAGLALKRSVQAAFENPLAVSGFLLLTAGLLALSELLGDRTRSLPSLRWMDALWIGAAQILALFPGVSRSGTTIAGGLTRNLRRAEAARFSFLMSIPIMIGAGLIALKDLTEINQGSGLTLPLVIGFIAAALVGYLSIRWLIAYLSRRPLTIFIVYCTVIGLTGLLMSVLHG